jgi:ubiquinone/menaquinone biosynthesis C-methylase UbiE
MAHDPGPAMTERLLRDAGLRPGMRLLDVGCGYGRVAEIAARLVGPEGEVVAIDRDAPTLEAARQRLSDAPRISLLQADLLSPPAGPFDAVVGRRVLMYQPCRQTAVRVLAATLRPGGLMVFEEVDAEAVPRPSRPHPLHEQIYRVVWETVRREGATLSMGQELAGVMREAGLQVEHVRAEAIVQTPEQRHVIADIVRAIAPRIFEHGAATAEELDLDTLDERLAAELRATGGPFIGDMVFGVWARSDTK